MLEEASSEIADALGRGARSRADETRLTGLIRQIDALLWELESLNLKDRRFVPDDLLPRITHVVAAATGSEPSPTAEVRRPMVALDRLFEAQGHLTALRCGRRGFVVNDREDDRPPAWPVFGPARRPDRDRPGQGC